MNLFFEDGGSFKTALILQKAGEAFQVEMPGGRRAKVRARDVVFEYASPDIASFAGETAQLMEELDISFLWEAAEGREFDYTELGKEYFGREMTPVEAASLLMKLHAFPMYFYKKGRGRYKAAPAESLNAALASIERKKKEQELCDAYAAEIVAGRMPEAVSKKAFELLVKPDKNGIEYKAMTKACDETHTNFEKVLMDSGAIPSAKALHDGKFLFEYFPAGPQHRPAENVPGAPDWPVSGVKAFSIDDSRTTEIDDALSVSFRDDGSMRVGVHIAAPAAGIMPGDAFDAVARKRMSTVYTPGEKITMLPDELVSAYTLSAGDLRPVLSLYADVDADLRVTSVETKAERITVAENLRTDELEKLITKETMAGGDFECPFKRELTALYRLADVLEQARMDKRAEFGLSPAIRNRLDFNFIVGEDGIVSITRRERGAPLDKIVSEMMILANSTWALQLEAAGIPGIFRSQAPGAGPWNARLQVKMVTRAAPHQGLGVDAYVWATSPLRRYCDLVNQWQLLAMASGEKPPFSSGDADLFAIVGAFDSLYTVYAAHQTKLERYWCLKWLRQNNVTRAQAVVIRDELVRLNDIPLYITIVGMENLPAGSVADILLSDIDEVTLGVSARIVSVTEAADGNGMAADEDTE